MYQTEFTVWPVPLFSVVPEVFVVNIWGATTAFKGRRQMTTWTAVTVTGFIIFRFFGCPLLMSQQCFTYQKEHYSHWKSHCWLWRESCFMVLEFCKIFFKFIQWTSYNEERFYARNVSFHFWCDRGFKLQFGHCDFSIVITLESCCWWKETISRIPYPILEAFVGQYIMKIRTLQTFHRHRFRNIWKETKSLMFIIIGHFPFYDKLLL